MNTDYTDFTYNSLEQIHEIFCITRWRDSLVAGKLLFVSCLKLHRSRGTRDFTPRKQRSAGTSEPNAGNRRTLGL